MIKLGSVHVSSQEQNLALQLAGLKREECRLVFTDKVSEVKARKANFEKLMEYARPDDTIVTWKLDWLGPGTIKLIEELKNREVNLKLLSESIDTRTATGNLFFQFMCVSADHECNVVRERTKAALYSTRAKGQTGKFKRTLTKNRAGS